MKKKLICIIFTAILSLSFVTPAYADRNDSWMKDKKNIQVFSQDKGKNDKGKKQKKEKKYKPQKAKFDSKKSPVIKHGRYKLPVNPVTKGMGAEVDYKGGVLTVSRDEITIVIDFKKETVTINGTIDKTSDIFKPKKNNGMTVLIKYIANILGVRVDIDDDDIIVEGPKFDLPKNITILPVGSTMISNTINTTTLYLTATADIKAGQATGGRAELYVDSKLVAVDTVIGETDTTVTFNTSDGTPTNEKLRNLIPKGGEVKVKLYNSNNEYVTGKMGEKLVVDYEAPTITGFTSASYDATKQELYIFVTGAGAIGDKVDVTLLTIYDPVLGRYHQLTSSTNGSTGIVNSENSLVVDIGDTDRIALSSYDTSNMYINIAEGSLIKDLAGNQSLNLGLRSIPIIVVK